jgi:hypothetical protein
VTLPYLFSTGTASNNQRVVVPWQQISDNPHKFIHKQYLPDHIQLQEPSKMHYSDVKHLCSFLHQRQTLGEKVFHFHYILAKHQQGSQHTVPHNTLHMFGASDFFPL